MRWSLHFPFPRTQARSRGPSRKAVHRPRFPGGALSPSVLGSLSSGGRSPGVREPAFPGPYESPALAQSSCGAESGRLGGHRWPRRSEPRAGPLGTGSCGGGLAELSGEGRAVRPSRRLLPALPDKFPRAGSLQGVACRWRHREPGTTGGTGPGASPAAASLAPPAPRSRPRPGPSRPPHPTVG